MLSMTSRRRRALVALAIAGAAISFAGVGAKVLLPLWLRGALEGAASRALGRDLEIIGPLDLTLLPAPRLEAGGVTLANAPWGSEPSMARVARPRRPGAARGR